MVRWSLTARHSSRMVVSSTRLTATVSRVTGSVSGAIARQHLVATPQPSGAPDLAPVRVEQGGHSSRVGAHDVGEQVALQRHHPLLVTGSVAEELVVEQGEQVGLGFRLGRGDVAGVGVAGDRGRTEPGSGVRQPALAVGEGGRVGEPVRLLVELVTGMPLDPLEADPAALHGGVHAFMISTFCTGLPSPLRQFLRFQPAIHLVIELIAYVESQ